MSHAHFLISVDEYDRLVQKIKSYENRISETEVNSNSSADETEAKNETQEDSVNEKIKNNSDLISSQESLHSKASFPKSPSSKSSFSDFEHEKYQDDFDVNQKMNTSFPASRNGKKKKRTTRQNEHKQHKRLSKNKISKVIFPPGKQDTKFNSKINVRKAWLKL
jgi:hypothetical protein